MPAQPSSARMAPVAWIVAMVMAGVALFGVFAVLWTTYDSFGHQVFDLRVAVLAPLGSFIEACTCP